MLAERKCYSRIELVQEKKNNEKTPAGVMHRFALIQGQRTAALLAHAPNQDLRHALRSIRLRREPTSHQWTPFLTPYDSLTRQVAPASDLPQLSSSPQVHVSGSVSMTLMPRSLAKCWARMADGQALVFQPMTFVGTF